MENDFVSLEWCVYAQEQNFPRSIGLGDFEKNLPRAQVSKNHGHNVMFLSSGIKQIIYSGW